MISLLRRYRKPLFVAIIIIFLFGTFVGLGGYLLTSRDTSGSVASVGAVKIPYPVYMRRVNQYVDALRERGGDVTEAMVKEVKQEMLRDMIVDELLLTKADEMGLAVTDDELSRDIRNTPAFQRAGVFSEDAYFQTVQRYFRDTPEAFEDTRRKSLKTGKLKQLIFQTAKLTPAELQEWYARENKGSMKDFEKNKAAFEGRVQQQRALELINYYLRQISAQVEIHTYLDEREKGV